MTPSRRVKLSTFTNPLAGKTLSTTCGFQLTCEATRDVAP